MAKKTSARKASLHRNPGATEHRWRSRIPKQELVAFLAEGRSYSAIGRIFNTDHRGIMKLVPALTREDLLQIVKARPVVQVPITPVRHLTAVDIPEEMMRVLDTLHGYRDFMESSAAEVAFPEVGRRMLLTLQVLDRIQKFMPEFLALQAKLSEWTGYDLWRDEILKVLDEISPGLREKLLQRLTAKVFVERGPAAAHAAARALVDPSISPESVPPSLRSMLSSPAPKPHGSGTIDGSSATSAPGA